MINYRFGDRVEHSEYGRCVFGEYRTPDRCVIFNGAVSLYCCTVDITPADPRIIQISGTWHRVYTPLDTEEAMELIGKEILYGNGIEALYLPGTNKLADIEIKSSPYRVGTKLWTYIAAPIESEPEKKPEPDSRVNPIFQPVLDAIYTASREMEEKG